MIRIRLRQRSDNGRRLLARVGAVLLFLVLGTVAFSAAAAEIPLKKASFIPFWSPQAQFAGYYVALDKGIYARHGIDLTILKGGPGHSPAQSMLSGEADFAVLWLPTALQQQAKGNRLVNLAQLVQRSSMMLIAKKSSGISTPAEMQGKKVGLWGGDLSLPAEAFLKKYGLSVRKIPQSYTVNLFLRGGIDVASAMWYNEYHTLLNAGLDPEELNVFFLYDYGMNFPEDGLYALAKTLDEDPALAAAFVRASLEGWRYAFAHPDEALDIVIKQMREAQLPANRMHQAWMLERMRDLILPGPDQGTFGVLNAQDYEAVGSAMQKDGLIPDYPDYTTFTRRSDAGKE